MLGFDLLESFACISEVSLKVRMLEGSCFPLVVHDK